MIALASNQCLGIDTVMGRFVLNKGRKDELLYSLELGINSNYKTKETQVINIVITTYIFNFFQNFLKDYCKDKPEWEKKIRKIRTNNPTDQKERQFLGIMNSKNGLEVCFGSIYPFTPRINCSIIRVWNNRYFNANTEIHSRKQFDYVTDLYIDEGEKLLSEFRKAVANYEFIPSDIELKDDKGYVYYKQFVGADDKKDYLLRWIDVQEESLKRENLILSRLDINIDTHIIDRRSYRILIKCLQEIADYDGANFKQRVKRPEEQEKYKQIANNFGQEYQCTRTINRDSFFFEGRLKNQAKYSLYNKHNDNYNKLNELEEKITEVKRKREKTRIRDARLNYEKQINVFLRQKKETIDDLNISKDKYRIEVRYFDRSLKKRFGSCRYEEIMRQDFKEVVLDDINRRFGSILCTKILDTQKRREIEKALFSGKALKANDIMEYLIENTGEARVEDISEHFTFNKSITLEENIPIENVDYIKKNGTTEIIEFDSSTQQLLIRRIVSKRRKKITVETVRRCIRILEKYNLAVRCKGVVSLTPLAYPFLKAHPLSKEIAFRMNGCVLGIFRPICNTREMNAEGNNIHSVNEEDENKTKIEEKDPGG